MYAIEMQGITKTFHGSYANKEVSLKVEQGEIHSLLGENGAGKSHLDENFCSAFIKPTRDGFSLTAARQPSVRPMTP